MKGLLLLVYPQRSRSRPRSTYFSCILLFSYLLLLNSVNNGVEARSVSPEQPQEHQHQQDHSQQHQVVADDGGVAEKKLESVEKTKPEDISIQHQQEDDEDGSVVKKRRRNDVLSGKSLQQVEGIDEAEKKNTTSFLGTKDSEGIRRFDGQVQDQEEEGKDLLAHQKRLIENKRHRDQVADIEEEVTPEVHNDLRKENVSAASREHRYLVQDQGKSKQKNSAVFLNAEEEKTPAGIQESIVDGQIKKLISIRDDALGSVAVQGNSNNDFVEVVDSKKVERSIDDRVKRWKEQALRIQEEIQDKTLIERLRGQDNILPDLPKFDENELLDTLKNIVSSKKLDIKEEELYTKDLGTTLFNETELRILKCGEQLLEGKQRRQSFINGIRQCITRGLSIINCMRAYIWPIMIDNAAEMINNNADFLPIEINLIDLFQGNRETAGKSLPLLTAESVISGILKSALQLNPGYPSVPSYIDPKNETLRKLLTPIQMEILQIGEKFLPETARREYSDRMFSCVRRFEYFSCIKFFAWPMMKQYFPPLPAFPDYQNLYPTIALIPEYPIVPFPGFSDGGAELPEVVEADATRMRKPKPETVIAGILENLLRSHTKTPLTSSILDNFKDKELFIIPQDQLMSIHMAEQLLPIQYRSEYVQKTVQCIREYNYLSCIKFSTWPLVKQFNPSLPEFPEFSNWIPEFSIPSFDELFGIGPELPDFSDFTSWITGTEPQPTDPVVETPIENPSYIFIRQQYPTLSVEKSKMLESKIIEILEKIRESLKTNPEFLNPVSNNNVLILTPISEDQMKILRLAESILPSPARAFLVARVFRCLQESGDFLNCTKTVVWPSIGMFATNLPEFPDLKTPGEMDMKKEIPELKPVDRVLVISSKQQPQQHQQHSNRQHSTARPAVWSEFPLYSISGTRVIPNYSRISLPYIPSFPQRILSYNLDNAPPILHARYNNFYNLVLPPSPPQSPIQRSSNIDPLSTLETKVKVAQHGEAMVTTTDTRFIPINEHPETFILNILKSIQQAHPAVHEQQQTPLLTKNQEFFNNLFTDQQETIIRITESLLPDSVRPPFINRMIECVRRSNFTSCTREVLWPTLNEYFQRLPNLPNFIAQRINGTLPSEPVTPPSTETPPLSETNVKTGKHGDAKVTITDTRFVPIFNDHPESLILNILNALRSTTTPNFQLLNQTPYPVVIPQYLKPLSERQRNITFIIENLLPESERLNFNEKMMNCLRENIFLICIRDVAWPMLARYFTTLPNFPDFGSQLNIPKSSIPVEKLQEIDSHEAKIESILRTALAEELSAADSGSGKGIQSRLDVTDLISHHLSDQQVNIIKLVETGIPDPFRRDYVAKILDCIRGNDFIDCSRRVSWPTLKQYKPSLPEFPTARSGETSQALLPLPTEGLDSGLGESLDQKWEQPLPIKLPSSTTTTEDPKKKEEKEENKKPIGSSSTASPSLSKAQSPSSPDNQPTFS